jgi:hydroxymethylpyrimidine pyrophosphatase-like HAD family hydrolase
MKKIDELADVGKINLIVFDVDGVIVPRGTKILEKDSFVTFNLKFPSKEFIELARELLNYTNIALSSGRNMLTLKTVFADLFGEVRNGNHFILQAENGGRLSMGADEISAGHNPDYVRTLSVLRSQIREIEHEHIIGHEPKETFLTIHCRDKIQEIENLIDKNTHYVIWNGEAYDIGDPNINKGSGLRSVKKELSQRTGKEICAIAIGDRHNDIDLLKEADISVSADPKLLSDADYFISDDADELPGVIFAKHLLKRFKEG